MKQVQQSRSPEQIAFAAGLFDGEGCIQPTRKDGKTYVRLVVNMTDLEPLEHMQRIYGGTIRGPYQPSGSAKKERWTWQLGGWSPVAQAMAEMSKWLCPRRLRRWAEIRVMQPPPKPKPIYGPNCGRNYTSSAGASRHRRRGERPCLPCVEAARAYDQERRDAKG